MTYKEALSTLRNFLDCIAPIRERVKTTLGYRRFEALNKAIEAIEKQIPKKPLHMHKNYYCPICKEDGWILWDDAVPNDMDKYCGKCGQALDWEVSE